MSTLDKKIETALTAYDPFKADLEHIQTLTDLVVTSPDDVEAFEQVTEARKGVKRFLVRVESTRKALKREALEYGRAVDAGAREITAIAAPVRKHLEDQEDVVLAERRRISMERDRERQRVLVARVESLSEFGVVMTTVDVAALSKDEYHRTLKEAQAIWVEKDKAREEKEAQEAAQRAQAEAEAKEAREAQEKENARLRAEREALEAEKKQAREEAALRQQELDRQAAAVRAAQEAQERAEREKAEAEQKAKEEAERKARIEALRPDVEKILAYADAVQEVPLPELDPSKPSVLAGFLGVRDRFHEDLVELCRRLSQ